MVTIPGLTGTPDSRQRSYTRKGRALMNTRKNIPALIIVLVLGCAAGTLWSRNSAQAQRRRTVQWDYCAINSIGYGKDALKSVATLTYLTASGVRTEQILGDETSPGTYGSIPMAVSKAITRLGADGWELVGNGNVNAGSSWLGGLFFKRPR
jgi:hypothetical protein